MAESQSESVPVQDLPPTHPEDPTQTSLQQPGDSVSDESVARAQAARQGADVPSQPSGSSSKSTSSK